MSIDLRDQFFALAAEPSDEVGAFIDRVNSTDSPATIEIDGLAMSYHPSARFKAVRFIDADKLDADVRDLFARPSSTMPHLAAVFVDPEEFSYRTFENIIPLDRQFDAALELSMHKLAKLGDARNAEAFAYRVEGSAGSLAALTALDDLDLYVEPLNSSSRGGRRFIFHSEKLSEALGSAVRNALPKPWLKGFSHVNPIFRCNRFEPGDAPFSRHVDTPYYDAARNHISRYTLLLYLTAGSGESILSIASRSGSDIELERVEGLTAVVFGQDLEHAGAAFDDGRKVFLRTELIYEDANVVHEPAIAQMFAKACYLTGESVFAPELAKYSHDLYDRAAQAHWRGVESSRADEPLLRKRFRGVDFMTNGYDFWFSADQLSPQEAAAIAVLDVGNAKVFGNAFRKQCETTVIEPDSPAKETVDELVTSASSLEETPFTKLPIDQLFPPGEEIDEAICCPFHCDSSWQSSRNAEIVDFFERAQSYSRRRLTAAPITMMGEEFFLDPERFAVEPGKIHVLVENGPSPVNFAACWNDESAPPNYVEIEASIKAPKLLVPPILFHRRGKLIHLMVDLFRNSWMVNLEQQTVPVPKLTDEPDWNGDGFGSPWMSAANEALGGGDSEDDEDDDIDDPWWLYEESPVALALYADDD